MPEQYDNNYVDLLVEEHHLNQGELWEILLKVAAKNKDLDVSNVYFQPEGDIFVAYSSSYELSKKMEIILNKLISDDDYLIHTVKLSSLNNI
ncbi:Imm51 family immunity protein [Seonamhaeicola sp.]|uniref:Imm51 family immunity protein n=1 Tax=Seonamhaeicola sp. TaxID=1912245 RepID=UPI003564FDC0